MRKASLYASSMRNEILRAAMARFGEMNRVKSNDREWRFGRSGSKRVDPETGFFQDFETTESGYLLDHRRTPSQAEPVRAAPAKDLEAWRDYRRRTAADIFARARPIAGTLGEKYLREARRISLNEWPAALRYHPRCARGGATAPAIVAELRDIATDAPSAVQRIFIKPDGSGRDGDRMMLGAARGAVCKLNPDADVAGAVGIAEGVETALAAMSIGWRPIWAAMSAGGVRTFPVLNGVSALTIFADCDEAGLEAARSCARRWELAGREVRIIYPRESGADWNDAI